jgi:hypothetical protein
MELRVPHLYSHHFLSLLRCQRLENVYGSWVGLGPLAKERWIAGFAHRIDAGTMVLVTRIVADLAGKHYKEVRCHSMHFRVAHSVWEGLVGSHAVGQRARSQVARIVAGQHYKEMRCCKVQFGVGQMVGEGLVDSHSMNPKVH